MAALFLNDVTILAGAYNLSGNANSTTLGVNADALDVTTFSSGGARAFTGGLKNASFRGSGYWEAGGANKPDDAAWGNLSIPDTPLTVSTSAVDGSAAYGFLSNELTYSQGGKVGDVYPFNITAAGRGFGMARGNLVHPATTARTSSGTGNFVNLGTLSATQKLLVLLHVTNASGTTPSLTVALQRDDNSGFTSPATVNTFAAATTTGSQYFTALGPVTPDNFYRITWTITGTSPSFNFAVFVGIVS